MSWRELCPDIGGNIGAFWRPRDGEFGVPRRLMIIWRKSELPSRYPKIVE